MAKARNKDFVFSKTTIGELLKGKYSDSLSDLDIKEAKNNILGFFKTLLEIAKENPELINQNAQVVLLKKDYKH